jgi:hypothetical protein
VREHLKAIEGRRALFRAKFARFDSRTSGGYFVPTALFVDVRNEQGVEVCDHIWMRKGKQIDALSLNEGDEIEFMATSRRYWSGYIDKHLNYGLKYPTKLRKITKNAPEIESLPLFAQVAQR